MLLKAALAAVLLAHAAIHLGFVSRPPVTAGGPPWPFDAARSWLLGPLGIGGEATRLLSLALVAATLGSFALAALAALGVATSSLWVPAAIVGSVGSIALLVLFFHPWLVLGVVIDVVLLWAVIGANWSPATIG